MGNRCVVLVMSIALLARIHNQEDRMTTTQPIAQQLYEALKRIVDEADDCYDGAPQHSLGSGNPNVLLHMAAVIEPARDVLIRAHQHLPQPTEAQPVRLPGIRYELDITAALDVAKQEFERRGYIVAWPEGFTERAGELAALIAHPDTRQCEQPRCIVIDHIDRMLQVGEAWYCPTHGEQTQWEDRVDGAHDAARDGDYDRAFDTLMPRNDQ